MNNDIKEIKFIEYNGIEGYIELMKHDVEPLKNPKCERIDLCYNGKDIKAVLDYITNLQKENKRLDKDLQTSIDICNNRQKEIVRLNNIINELERYITSNYKYYTGVSDVSLAKKSTYKDLLDYLKELKEGK